MNRARLAAGVLVLGLAAAGCSHDKKAVLPSPAAPASSAVSAPTDLPAAPASDTAGPAGVTAGVTAGVASSAGTSPSAPASNDPATTHPASATPHPTAVPKPTAAPTRTALPAPKPAPKPTPLLVEQLASVGGAQQVVIVTAASSTTDVATLQTFEQDSGTWRAVFPAMAAHIGRAGFSADKHEGDLKTPQGMYGFGTMFGQRTNPGVKFPYRQADSQSVWVDDVHSPYYNTWQENAALSGEHLAAAGYATAYAYAVDIAYNTSPVVPGKGSAIFLHVSTGGGTAGCVSIAQSNLLEVLRWLDPAKKPVIVMGPTAAIRQY